MYAPTPDVTCFQTADCMDDFQELEDKLQEEEDQRVKRQIQREIEEKRRVEAETERQEEEKKQEEERMRAKEGTVKLPYNNHLNKWFSTFFLASGRSIAPLKKFSGL